jgi:drug/metabolite transporter (DMT)-like permease
MTAASNNLKGIGLMCLSSASFVVNDTVVKLITQHLPPYETLFLRGIAMMVLGAVLLFATGHIKSVPKLFDPVVLGRNGFEVLSTLGFILGLAYAPMADLSALTQLSPILLTVVAVWFLGARIGRVEVLLISLAFVGALLVAQPGGSGFSAFALWGLWTSGCSVARDLVGRKVSPEIPGLVVAVGAGLTVMLGGLVMMLLFEDFVMPDLRLVIMMCTAALFLTGGHLCVFLAFRHGEVTAVSPFAYMSMVWALVSGAVVFGTLPNALGFVGIGLIVIGGVGVVLLEGRRAQLGKIATT